MTDDPFQSQRRRLLALAYRLLGAWAEAEDVVQDAHLVWLQQQAQVDSPRAFLERVVTNRCLDVMKSARARRQEYVGPWLPEPLVTERALVTSEPADLEAVSFAFLALLELLSPLERAAFVLAEAFDYSHDELATALGREPSAVRQLLHRARDHVAKGRPRFAADRAAHEAMLATFLEAVSKGEVAGVERLLVDAVTAKTDGCGRVRAAVNVVTGANRVARFLLGLVAKQPADVRYELHDVNGWPSVVAFSRAAVWSVTQLETDGARVFSVSTVVNPDKLRALGAHVTGGPEASSSST